MSAALFVPYKLRDLTLPNRIVVSPMGQYAADEEGKATTWHLVHLGGLALSGAGLLITEATAVHPCGRISKHDLGIWTDSHAEALAPTIAFCRKHGGAKLGMQLYHAGRKASVTVPWERQKSLSVEALERLNPDESRQRSLPIEEGGWPIYSASAIAVPGRATPLELSHAEIKSIIGDFVDATRRADRIGIDLLELHAAHGYLLHGFLSEWSNQRTDEYGGSRENRMRMTLEVFEQIREVWPEKKPLGVRISATDWTEWTEQGWNLNDSVALAVALKKLGCDFITVSSGGATPEQKIDAYPGYQVPLAERIRREAEIPTMAVGLIKEPHQAEAILANGRADLVALGRGFLFNPRWPWHAAIELDESVFFPPQYRRAHPAMRGCGSLKAATGA